jgi:hypothetical protein
MGQGTCKLCVVFDFMMLLRGVIYDETWGPLSRILFQSVCSHSFSFNINSHCIKSIFIYQLVITDVIGKPWQWCSNTIKVWKGNTIAHWYQKFHPWKMLHYIQILTTIQFAMVFICQLWKVSLLFCLLFTRRFFFIDVPKPTYAHSYDH